MYINRKNLKIIIFKYLFAIVFVLVSIVFKNRNKNLESLMFVCLIMQHDITTV